MALRPSESSSTGGMASSNTAGARFSRPAPGIAKQIGVPGDRLCTVVEIAAAARNGDFLYYQELTVPASDRRLELADPTSVHHPL